MGSLPRTPRTDISSLPASLPSNSVPPDFDLDSFKETVAPSVLERLSNRSLTGLLKNAIWRDCLALTGTFRTIYGEQDVQNAWLDSFQSRSPGKFHFILDSLHLVRLGGYPAPSWVTAPFIFETQAHIPSRCSGLVYMAPNEVGEWKIWMIQTILEGFQGHGNVDQLAKSLDPKTQPRSDVGPSNSLEVDALVIGGGQNGLSVSGRLKALGISQILIDRNERIGDNWNLRYKSMKLHTPRDYTNLPFERTFSKDDPDQLPKARIAAAYAEYVEKYGINVWLSSSVETATWNAHETRWTVKVVTSGERQRKLIAKHVILAVGVGTESPLFPDVPGLESFKGEALHSYRYQSATAWKGKNAVVIGSGNTAHDVAEDMLDAGATSVTMVQRGKTYVFASGYLKPIFDPIYNQHLPTEIADRAFMATPIAVARLLAMGAFHSQAKRPEDAAKWDALEQAGFNLERYGDLINNLYDRLGGYYVDVGACDKIIDGRIKMKSDSAIQSFAEDGIKFEDGSKVPADVIVLATGYQKDHRSKLLSIFGEEVERQMDDYWGLDSEGEVRGVWKPAGHPGLWIMAGDVAMARFYSRFVALQIQAELLGNPLPRYERKFR